MKRGNKVVDKYGEHGIIDQVFYNLVEPKSYNKFKGHKSVVDAVLIKVNEKHYLYRKKGNFRLV